MTNLPLGILGGIFDPVHNGHLSLATLARDCFSLDTIVFIPSGTPPHKTSSVCASGEERLKMLRIALRNFDEAHIWESELRRNGYSYTIDSLHQLRDKYGSRPIHFIVGSDNLTEIKTWREFRQILEMVTLCVAHRPGFAMDIPEELAGAKIETFASPQWALSSSMLRSYIRKGLSCRYLMPDPVISYIYENKLYGSA